MEDGDTVKYHPSSVIQDLYFSSWKSSCIRCISLQVYNNFQDYWEEKGYLNYFLVSGDICHLLITFANSLDFDQYRLNVCPDLDSNRLTL